MPLCEPTTVASERLAPTASGQMPFTFKTPYRGWQPLAGKGAGRGSLVPNPARSRGRHAGGAAR
jgi:hypothetical protein